jgi:hypothetical protein
MRTLTQLCVATTVRSTCLSSGRARPLWVWHSVYVKKFVIFRCCFAPALRAGPRAISLSRVSGSRGGGAESHTYSPHDARGMRIRALEFRQRTSIPLALFIHSALPTPEGMAPEHDNKVLLSFPNNEVRGGMFFFCHLPTESKFSSHIASATVMHRPTDRYFIVVISKSVQYDE